MLVRGAQRKAQATLATYKGAERLPVRNYGRIVMSLAKVALRRAHCVR